MTTITKLSSAWIVACVLCIAGSVWGADAGDDLATLALKTSGSNQGLCLVLNPDGGALVAALAKGSRMYVQGCTWEEAKVQAGRQAIVAAGVAERASLLAVETDSLPYADNLINLAVAPKWGASAVTIDEVLRVLTPGGMALLGNDGTPTATDGLEAKLKQLGVKEVKALSRKGWIALTKPLNPDYDTWTTNLGGADLSGVSNDKGAGPWDEVRWIGDPRWGALAGTYSGRVTGGGRFYYVEARSDHTYWVARDAYNGTELWRVPLEGRGWVPLQGPGNTLACDERWTYATNKEVLLARDGKTGEIAKEYKTPMPPRNVTPMGQHIVVSDIAKNICAAGSACAVEKETGKIAWTRPTLAPPPAIDGVAFVLNATDMEAVEIATGKSIWKTAMPKADGFPRVFCKAGNVYVISQPNWKPPTQLVAFNAKTGAVIWTDTTVCVKSGIPMTILDGLCFSVNSGKEQHVLVMDGQSGKVTRDIPVKGMNGKCYGGTGSAQYLMYGNGTYLDVKSGVEQSKGTMRSPCFLPPVTANGLTYFLPHHCDCGVTLRGFIAMARAGTRKWFKDEDKEREGSPKLVTTSVAPAPADIKPDDWSMYRKDMTRSNFTTTAIPEKPKLLWSEKLGDHALTQAIVAYGVVCLAEARSHRVFGRDAVSGKELWSFVADGEVTCAPALHKGLCFFGTSGGSVFALDAKTGKEVWRMRAAPAEKYIAEEGQIASTWPVLGGVLPMGDDIYFNCGRSVNVEGGIWMYAVNAATGKIRWRVRGGVSGGDIFLSDGKDLYLTKVSFNTSNGSRIGGGQAAQSKGLLRTTAYLTYVAVTDYMACVESSLSSEKHVELTDGNTTGENLAFNGNIGVAAWRYRFGVPGDMMKKDKMFQRFIYARGKDGAVKWRQDENINQQIMGVVMAGETVFMAGTPTSHNPSDKGELWVLNAADGKRLNTIPLEGMPAYDGLSASGGRLYMSTDDGRLMCFGN